MSILAILIPLIIVGVVLYCVNTFIPMDDRIRQVVNIVAIVLVLLWILPGSLAWHLDREAQLTMTTATARLLLHLYVRAQARQKFSPERLPELARLAERLEPGLRRRFLQAVDHARSNIQLEHLAEAINPGSLNATEAAVQLQRFPETFGMLALDLVPGFRVGVTTAASELARVDIVGSFTLVNAEAIRYAANRLPALVAPLQADAREFIRDETTRAMRGELTAMQVARRIRDFIGLYPALQTAVDHYRVQLEEDGANEIERRVARYAAAQLRFRAEMIARTEIMRAANAGHRAAWRDQVRQGLIDPAMWNRKWVVTWDERLCPQCAPYDDTTVPFAEEFDEGEPPLHPHCRCTIQLARVRALAVGE